MRGINKAILVGHVGNDPVTKVTGDFVSTRFSLATTYYIKNKETGLNEPQTEWHRIAAFGKLATIITTYVKKGAQLYIEGVIKTGKYTDKEGIVRYSTEIIANTMQMLGKKESHDEQQYQEPVVAETGDFNDDIPF